MLQAIFLGILQGLTEFLPVSSSGHLVLAGYWMQTRDDDVIFELLLHFGTLMATVLVFRIQIVSLLLGALKKNKEEILWVKCILLTTVVTALLGKTFESNLEKLFRAPLLVSAMLILTGFLIFIPRLVSNGERGPKKVTFRTALWIGLIQTVAIIPGISRSGSTIAAGLLLGLDRKKAGEYSFLISIPIIFGASVFKLKDLGEGVRHFSTLEMGVGVLAAFLSGLIALKWLLTFLHGGKLHYFSWYCWAAGVFGLFLFSR